MNWGTKIVIVFVLFVAGIVAMVIKASQQNTDLVVPDYYEQELKYQGRIEEINRTHALSAPVKCSISQQLLTIQLPAEMASQQIDAHIWLYCVADKKKDIQKAMQSSNGKFTVPLPHYNKGMHEVKISWVAANKQTYYYEQKIFIQ